MSQQVMQFEKQSELLKEKVLHSEMVWQNVLFKCALSPILFMLQYFFYLQHILAYGVRITICSSLLDPLHELKTNSQRLEFIHACMTIR